MDMRSKPIDTKSGKCWSCLGCRRRTISSKLTTIVVQVIVITVMWFIIKKSWSPSDPAHQAIRSSEDQGVSMCSQGEYLKGSSLLIQDIVSTSGSLDPDEKQKAFFLQVDILTRSAEDDSPTLYTVGTPVIMDGLFKGDNTDSISEKNKGEFYYDNSLDEKDMDRYSNSNNLAGEGTQDGVTENSVNGKEKASANLGGDANLLSGSVGQKNEFNNGVSNQGTKAPDDQALKNFIVNPQNEHKMGTGQLPREIQAPAIDMGQRAVHPNDFQQNQFNAQMIQKQNNQQIGSGLQFQPGQIQRRDQYGEPQNTLGMSVDNLRPDEHPINRQGDPNHDMVQIQEGQLQFQDNRVISPELINRVDGPIENNHNVNLANLQIDNDNIPQENTGMVGMNQAEAVLSSGNIPAEGFKDRLTRFKTEYYGRSVDDSSDPTTTSYALNNPSLCENLDSIDVLFVINTIPQSDEQRQRIRETFVKASLFQPYTIAHVFMIGLTPSPNFQGNLDKDHEEYGDIVQGEFVDKKETKTLKGLMGFRWVTTFCSKAKFVFKLDEDVFVDTHKLLQGLIPAVSNVIRDKAMLCFFVQNAPIPRSGPNAFDRNVFPKSSKMRPYCKGFAILTTVSTLASLVKASEHVPQFQFDDLYLYGILPFVAGGIEVYDLGNKRAFHDFGMAVVNCYKDLQDKCPYVATKAFSSRFTSLWEFVIARKGSEFSPDFQTDLSLWNIASFQSTFYS